MSKSIVVSVLASSPDPRVDKPVIWQVGSPVPMPGPTKPDGSTDPDNTTKIMRMFIYDGVVEVFALPVPGTEMDKLGQGLVFTLLPLAVKTVMAVARFDHWKELIQESEEAENDDEDEEEEEEIPSQPTQPVTMIPQQFPPPPPYIPNGQVVNTTPQTNNGNS